MLTLSAAGEFAYVANFGSDNVSAFAVDRSTGALTPTGQPVNAGNGPAWMTIVK
jgi:6-phosphogluconolactonase (cycloisomerase 2 family)